MFEEKSLLEVTADHPCRHEQYCNTTSCFSPGCSREESDLGQTSALKKKKLVLLTSELSAELSSFGLKEALPMVHPKVGKDWRSLAHTGVWRDEPVLAVVCRCIHQAGLFSRQISTCLY